MQRRHVIVWRMRRSQRRYVGPVISERELDAYFARRLDKHEWIKKLSYAELSDGLPKGCFVTKPRLHQLACFNIGMDCKQFLFFLDMGAGKTKISLDLIRYHMRFNGLRRTLIVAPRDISIQTWLDEIDVHAPDLTTSVLLGSRRERERALRKRADLYLINYAGLQVFATSLQPSSRAHKRHREIDKEMLQTFASRFGGMVIDESHKIGHPTALVTRIVCAMSPYFDVRYGLTGTPFGRDPTLLFPQFLAIDQGETLGRKLSIFRGAFFRPKQNYWGGLDWSFRKRLSARLHRMLQHRSIRYSDDEFADLPPVSKQVLHVPMSENARDQCAAILRDVRKAKGNISEYKNAYIRMRMVASGFLAVKTEQGERLQIRFKDNPKMDALRELVTSIPEGRKMIVFHEYTLSGDMIVEMLDDENLTYSRLSGKRHGIDQREQLRMFLHDSEVRFMVAQNEVGHASLNPQRVCNYACFYESPSSPIVRRQAEKRLSREGQKHHVYIYDVCARPGIEERILEYLKEGKDLFDGLVAGNKAALASLLMGGA